MSKSELESTLALYIRANELPEPITQLRFHPKRRWMFDFAWPAQRVALEVEGGVWSGGRHTSGKGFTDDCVKYNEATLQGWRVLRVTGGQIEDGSAIDWLRRALTPQGAEPSPF